MQNNNDSFLKAPVTFFFANLTKITDNHQSLVSNADGRVITLANLI